MKIAIVANANSATYVVGKTLAEGLRKHGIDAILLDADFLRATEDFAAYGLVHFPYYAVGERWRNFILPPMTANVWQLPSHKLDTYCATLLECGYSHLIVDDVMTLQLLGQRGFTDVTTVPLLFDPLVFHHLPIPPEPFTVGAFGAAYSGKRFEVIESACELAKVDFYCAVQPVERKLMLIDPMRDVYAHAHVFAHASFYDTNSLPMLEALACGRPVISTHNDGIHRVLHDGVNGLYYDGSVRRLADAILKCRDDYAMLVAGAHQTAFPSVDDGVASYLRMFRATIAGDANDD